MSYMHGLKKKKKKAIYLLEISKSTVSEKSNQNEISITISSTVHYILLLTLINWDTGCFGD